MKQPLGIIHLEIARDAIQAILDTQPTEMELERFTPETFDLWNRATELEFDWFFDVVEERKPARKK